MLEFLFAIFEAICTIFTAIGTIISALMSALNFLIEFAIYLLIFLPAIIIFVAHQIFLAFDFNEYAAFIELHFLIIGLSGYVIEYLIFKYRYNVKNFFV